MIISYSLWSLGEDKYKMPILIVLEVML